MKVWNKKKISKFKISKNKVIQTKKTIKKTKKNLKNYL